MIKGYIEQSAKEFAELGLLDFACLKWANLLRKTSIATRRLYRPSLPAASISDEQLLGLASQKFHSCKELAAFISRKPRFTLDYRNKDTYVDLIRQHYPDTIPATIAKADQICKHVFDLLGYQKLQLPPKIDWNSDPVSGASWDGYYLNIDCLNLEAESDIRIPWELSRFQHFIILGQAYWYAKDEKYAKEFVSQLEHWLEDNPPEWGINWNCSMELALRSISWTWSYYFFLDSPSFTTEIQLKLIKSLIQHARHIISNLEGNPYGRYSNHYISNGLGLFCLGLFLADFNMGDKWLNRGLDILWREAEKQIYPDGVDYEQSIDYHRQVLEFFLLAISLCEKNNITVPKQVRQKVEKMLDFTLSYIRSDGSVPMIGDADNGWLWSLGGNGHLSCLAAGAVIFSKPELKANIPKLPEAFLWLLGTTGVKAYEALSKPEKKTLESKAYKQAGFYIMRHNDLHLALRCGKYGSHGHSDILSLDLFACGQHFIADPGTYNYTGSYKWRNYFRSTFSHNTVRVDEQEFHPLTKETLWFIEGENRFRVNNWKSSAEYDFFDAEHYCYHKLRVTHRRQVLFVKQEGYFIINDTLSGSASHKVELIFNLAPLQVELSPAGIARCANVKDTFLLIIPDSKSKPEAKLTDSWISYKYGAKQPTKKLVYTIKAGLPTKAGLPAAGFFTILYPGRGKPSITHEQINTLARQTWEQYTSNLSHPNNSQAQPVS